VDEVRVKEEELGMVGYLRMIASGCRGFRWLPTFPAPPQWKILRGRIGSDESKGKREEWKMAGYLRISHGGPQCCRVSLGQHKPTSSAGCGWASTEGVGDNGEHPNVCLDVCRECVVQAE